MNTTNNLTYLNRTSAATAILVVLAFLTAHGMEVFFGYVASFEFLFKKHYVLGHLVSVLAAYLLLIYSRTKVSFENIFFTLLFAVIFSFASLRDLLVFSTFEPIVLSELFSVLLVALIIREYEQKLEIDVYGIFYFVVCVLAATVLARIIFTHNEGIVDLASIGNLRLATHLGFVNSFAYVCAFGILCGIVSWLGTDRPRETQKKINVIHIGLLVFPLLYLLISKSKGGIAVTFIGSSILFFRVRTILLVSGAILSIVVLAKSPFLVNLFYRFMMLGREAPEDQIVDKVSAMFSNRFSASEFFRNPAGFLNEHPFGIGLSNALDKIYIIPGKDVYHGNHSLLLIFIDSYGLLALVFLLVLITFTSVRTKTKFTLGFLMILIPLTFTNTVNFSYSIPITLMASSVVIRKRSFTVRRFSTKLSPDPESVN